METAQIDEEFETDELRAYFDDDEDSIADERSESDTQELRHLLSQIGGVIDCLLRLSVAISNPAPHDRFKSRVDSQVEIKYESSDIQDVRAKFPHLDRVIAERLGRALTKRRKYFKYRHDRHYRLKQRLDGDGDDASKVAATTVAPSLPQHLKSTSNVYLDAAENLELQGEVIDDDSGAPVTSYAASTRNQSELRVPPIPEEYVKGPFLCPFCYVYISVESRHEWK